jgi:membrane protein
LGYLADAIILSLKLLPYGVIWLVLTFIYVFMPNTKVELKSALAAGIVAGTLYQLVQLAYITFQIGVTKYGAIYGSFAALPLFLAWLQVSWLVVLFGAEVSFAHQHVATYEFEQDCERASHSFKTLVALLIACLCVKRYQAAEAPLTANDISRELEVPIRLVRSLLSELTEARVLSEVCLGQGEDVAYQPACDIDRLTVAKIIEQLDQKGVATVPIAETPDVQKLRKTLERFHETIEQSSLNLKLQDF